MKTKRLLIIAILCFMLGTPLVLFGCNNHIHKFSDQMTVPVTCTQDGELKRTCLSCGKTETIVIPKTGHNFLGGGIIRTQTHHYYLCQNGCGTIDEATYEEHTFVNNKCSVCDFDKASSDVLTFGFNHDGKTCCVTGFYGNNRVKDIVIPDTYNNYPVTSIAENAFNKNVTGISLRSVTLGRNITDVEYQAFWGNNELQTIVFPESVRTIGKWAFSTCTSLKNVVFNEGIEKIGYGAFMNCKLPETVTFPLSLKEIGSYAFSGATEIKHAILQNVEHLCEAAFYNCPALESVDLGNGNIVVDIYAMNTCPALTTVTVGDNIVEFGRYVLYGSNVTYHEADKVNYIGNAQNPCVVAVSAADKSITSFESKPETRVIADEAFSSCTQLQSVVLGDNVQMVGAEAFKNCSQIESVVIGNNVKTIGEMAFMNCSNLSTIELGSAIKEIHEDAFDGCSNLAKVKVAKIEDWLNIDFIVECESSVMAYRCGTSPLSGTRNGGIETELLVDGSVLTNLEVPNGIEKIAALAFANYTKLESVDLPESVKEIGTLAFYNTKALTSITVAQNNPYLYAEDNAVVTKSDKTLIASCGEVIPDGVKTIDDCVFYSKTFKGNVVIPNSVEEIGEGAFDLATIKNITMGSGIKKIGKSAFTQSVLDPRTITIVDLAAWCNIDMADRTSNPNGWGNSVYIDGEMILNQKLTIPAGVTEIKPWTFVDLSILDLYIPKETVKIATTAFAGSGNLGNIEIDPDNPVFTTEADGRVLLEGDTLLIGTRGTGLDLTGLDFTTIADYAFSSRNLDEIKLPQSLRKIGDNAFASAGITSFEFKEGLEEIGVYAFKDNHKVTTMELPASLKKIERSAFLGTSALETVKFLDANNWTEVYGETTTAVTEFSDEASAADKLQTASGTFVKNA